MPRRASNAEKPVCSSEDCIRMVLIAPSSNFECDGNNDNKPVICKLPHPKTGSCALYMFTNEDQKVSELVKFDEPRRSWFVGETVQKDGSLYISSHVDPIFLLLPYLSKASKQFGKFMELDCVIEDSVFPESKRLIRCSLDDLEYVSDMKDIGGTKVYRYNKEKTVSWLQLKVDRLTKALKQNCVDVSSGALIATFARSSHQSVDEDDYRRYAAGLIAEYLDQDLAKDFYNFIGISLEVSPTGDDIAVNPPSAKKCKFEVLAPTEDYCQTNSTAGIKKAEKLTTAQKQLNKVDKAGIKSISSFFSQKSTKK